MRGVITIRKDSIHFDQMKAFPACRGAAGPKGRAYTGELCKHKKEIFTGKYRETVFPHILLLLKDTIKIIIMEDKKQDKPFPQPAAAPCASVPSLLIISLS